MYDVSCQTVSMAVMLRPRDSHRQSRMHHDGSLSRLDMIAEPSERSRLSAPATVLVGFSDHRLLKAEGTSANQSRRCGKTENRLSTTEREAKRTRRRLKRRYAKSRSSTDLSSSEQGNRVIREVRSSHIRRQVDEAAGSSPGLLWQTVGRLLFQQQLVRRKGHGDTR